MDRRWTGRLIWVWSLGYSLRLLREIGLGLGWQNRQQKIEENGTERIPTPGLITLRWPQALYTEQGSFVAV